ncbi:MAG: hybrid sensor histidine kinase/response regulator [Verrucomicrobiales bacterium]|nr:hybrid sensor histidine kinase/response regulator [Verrucomicrobiales bacterium]
MKTPVKVLLLEDSESDGLLLACELERGGYAPEIERVWTGPKLDAALQDRTWDIIISDFSMPSFNAFEGLALLKKSGRDIPFVIVSGTIGEERAVAAMKAGAADYLPKGTAGRLVPVINRELADSRKRQLQRVTQKTLATFEGNFRTLVENSTAGICVIQDDRFVYVNPQVSQILGHSAVELVSRPFLDFVCSDDRDNVQANIHTRFEGGVKCISYPLRMVRKDGYPVHLEAHGTGTDYNGRPSIFCILTEIPNQKRVTDRFSTIAKCCPIGMAQFTFPESRFIEGNDAILEMLGLSREETIGRRVTDLGLWAESGDETGLIDKLSLGRRVSDIECRFQQKSGKPVITLASFQLIEEQEEKCLLGFFHDITEKKAVESQLMRNQRMESIGSLAGGISHDLNNAFASILMTVEMLRATSVEPEASRMLEVLQSSAQRGTAMVRQVLAFARGVEGKHSAVQLRHVIAEIVAMARQTFPKTIRIKQIIPRDLWPVNGDSTQLHQAILNFCINARDAMPKGGTLTLSAENVYLDEGEVHIHPDAKAGAYTTLSVFDTGTGIPLHVQTRMFEPFFTTKEPGQGTGLGLSTVRNILKSHKGFVTFETEEAKGTRFKIYLPAESTSKTSVGNVRVLLPRGHGQRILIVDDEAGIRDIARQLLQTFGYEVFTARNGPEAIVVCAKNLGKIEVIVTDLMMPVMDGSATIEAVRSIDSNIKVIVASEEILTDQTKISTTVQAILQKPYTPEKLLHTIHEVLRKTGPKISA